MQLQQKRFADIVFKLLKFRLKILKSAVSTLSKCNASWKNAKFPAEQKKFKFGTENALFGCFWIRILKDYCTIKTPEFVKRPNFEEKQKSLNSETKILYLGILE